MVGEPQPRRGKTLRNANQNRRERLPHTRRRQQDRAGLGTADWDRVAERAAWLRKEAPAGAAGKMVGESLYWLATRSRDSDRSFKAFEQEVAALPRPDPARTIAFARQVGLFDTENSSSQGLKYLRELPASQERDDAIQVIELNR